jgi:ankyrin repeat protein
MKCTHCEHCDLFPQFALNPALQVWQTHYCHGEYERCIRYQMSCRNETVPLNLLPNGSKVDLPRNSDEYGATALFNAILKSRTHMVESLFKHGVDVNVQNSDGMSPLMAAASTGNVEIVRMLVARGADLQAVNVLGETAKDIAVRFCRAEAAGFLQTAGTAGRGELKAATASTSPGGWLRRWTGYLK